MLFNSTVFLLFAAVFFALWPLLKRRPNPRFVYITAASFVFYGWWDWRFLLLIVASGLIDFTAALLMARLPTRRRLFLAASIAGNVGSLAVFKYSRFIAENIEWLLRHTVGAEVALADGLPDLLVILPVGISFYTFQSMSYTIDVYRERLEPTRNIFHFFAYLSMFPQLVAGPIVRGVDLLPQLRETPTTTEEQRFCGLRLIVHGFFKKVVIADNLALVVEQAFSASAPAASAPYWWAVMTMFAFQIYCDFSGYSDIARGLARWMGYDFPLNFDHPYTASSIRELWGRWHISLSTWFRDYVYLPLGGSRRGPVRNHLNVWITMVVSGLWHGASWTFVIWGALHALYLSIERRTGWPERLKTRRGGRIAATLIVLALTWIAWVFFRAESVGQALEIVRIMFSLQNAAELDVEPEVWTVLVIAVLREVWFFARLEQSALANGRLARTAAPFVLALMIVACIYFRGPGAAFIYFQF